MTNLDYALFAFTLFNSIRVFAYFPQMASIVRDKHGATAISYTTWTLFAASHMSTAAYGLFSIGDWKMGAVFAINTACCFVIIVLTYHKRRQFSASA